MDSASLKRKINNQLNPIKVMLMNRKQNMSKEDWLNLVTNTRRSILDHPSQYIYKDWDENLPIEIVIDQIFDEFLKDQAGPDL
jgi:hypothetical protein